MKPGHWTNPLKAAPYTLVSFRVLSVGRRYRVVKAFVDFDQHPHAEGEVFRFLGSHYSAYDSGVSLFVSLDGTDEWQIRLSDYDADDVAANLAQYLVEEPD